jgi:hypothetical protein
VGRALGGLERQRRLLDLLGEVGEMLGQVVEGAAGGSDVHEAKQRRSQLSIAS